MDVEIKREAAFAGQRVKQKVVFALALCSVIPLLVRVTGWRSGRQHRPDSLRTPWRRM